MKNVKRRPIPDIEQRRARKKSKPFAIHNHQPSGSKIGMRGTELDNLNYGRHLRRHKGKMTMMLKARASQ